MYGIKKDVDFLALSCVRDEQDVLEVVDMLIENDNNHCELIAKIENAKAVENLEEIAKVYETAEQKEPVIIDYKELEKVGVELIEDDLIIVEDNILRHNSLKLSSLIFSYLMRD